MNLVVKTVRMYEMTQNNYQKGEDELILNIFLTRSTV